MVSIEEQFPTREWGPLEVVYDFDTPSFHCFFIIEGSVDIFTPKGLKLNTINKSEIFGEASLLLGTKRSVVAKSGASGVKILEISKSYILGLQEVSPVLSAILRNAQLRLIDSNAQSLKYASHVESLLKIATELSGENQIILTKLETIKKQLANDFRVY